MRNAFYGYSFQELVTSLMLAKMDVERNIDAIEIEAGVSHKFDDIRIACNKKEYYFQIKDYDKVVMDDIIVSKEEVQIKGKQHKLSGGVNILFFSNIEVKPNCTILDIPAHKVKNLYIVSQCRTTTEQAIEKLYKADNSRRFIIDQFFSECLSSRKLLIKKEELPVVNVFKTSLIEPTVNIATKVLAVENILLIEGKPGIGKSHLVVTLEKRYRNNIVYRFWISNQDNEYKERLQFNNFISDLSKKIFGNLKSYTEEQIINELSLQDRLIIIDGLDHVENYNPSELNNFISFINNLVTNCKVIVLSRPLLHKLEWKKQVLDNWSMKQTKAVLTELYHIDDYDTCHKIYKISQGYPILVRYIAEQFKIQGYVPDFQAFTSIDNYYEEILKAQKGKSALSLFLCIRSYIMRSEIGIFLDEPSASFIKEFVDEHPYLFEFRLNRLSLFHDSLITYLRKTSTSYQLYINKVNDVAYTSIIGGHRKFQSRFNAFEFNTEQRSNIIKKYSSLKTFKDVQQGTVDYEALRRFYHQLREALLQIKPDELEIIEYFDLALILNIVDRDHVSALNGFLYTYCRSLLQNGYHEEDITSSEYLFSMLYYLKTNDGSLLLKTTSDSHYDTSSFFSKLKAEADEEYFFFEQHAQHLTRYKFKRLLYKTKDWQYQKTLAFCLEDLFIHKNNRKTYGNLYESIKYYMGGKEREGITLLEDFLRDLGLENPRASSVLRQAKENLLALGQMPESNDYLHLTLSDFILSRKHEGSFSLWVDILNFIRLALNQNRQIDINSISLFWVKYYQRKDYTLYSLDTVLPIFEKHGLVTFPQSVVLINKVQDMSEKGYRGLLADYILEHPPKFVNDVFKHFNAGELDISWFHLSAEYINLLPDHVYNIEMRELLRSHQHSGKIDFHDIENVLDSNRLDRFRHDLNLNRYQVRAKQQQDAERLKSLEIPYVLEKEQDYGVAETTPEELLDQGILNNKNSNLIQLRNLKSFEVASYSDGNYSALANAEIFSCFGESDITENIKQIIYNAMTSKTKSIDHFYSLYTLPGNLLKLLEKNQTVENFQLYYVSFLSYLGLSMFTLEDSE